MVRSLFPNYGVLGSVPMGGTLSKCLQQKRWVNWNMSRFGKWSDWILARPWEFIHEVVHLCLNVAPSANNISLRSSWWTLDFTFSFDKVVPLSDLVWRQAPSADVPNAYFNMFVKKWKSEGMKGQACSPAASHCSKCWKPLKECHLTGRHFSYLHETIGLSRTKESSMCYSHHQQLSARGVSMNSPTSTLPSLKACSWSLRSADKLDEYP